MLKALNKSQWTPVELFGWTRRAYGRKIFLETEGGTLRAAPEAGDGPSQIYLHFEVTGRVLVQVFCNGAMLLDDLVSNTELDTFIRLDDLAPADRFDIELHLIPAPYGTARIPQALDIVPVANPIAMVAH